MTEIPEIRGAREGAANVFRIKVNDPDQAFAAVLDVPGFYSTGSVVSSGSFFDNSSEDLEVFVVTGFPVTRDPRIHRPTLQSGEPKAVGATYTFSFPVGEKVAGTDRRKGEITIRTVITRLEDRPGFKEVAFHHNNTGREVPGIRCDCFPTPEVLYPETDTIIRIERNEAGDWEMRLSYTGVSGSDPQEREGCANYWVLTTAIFAVLPCFLLCAPCILYDEFQVMTRIVTKQMERVQAYCNSYDPSTAVTTYPYQQGVPTGLTSFQRSVPMGTKVAEEEARESFQRVPEGRKVAEEVEGSRTNYDIAIPVARVESQQTRTEELDRWYQLYKSGAISYAEYEAEKAKILASM